MHIATVAPLLALLPGVLTAQQKADPTLLRAAAGYAAKVAASAIFVSGRTLDSVLDEELAPDRPIEAMIRPLLRFDVDSEARSVTCHLGTVSATALATTGLGCTLLPVAGDRERLRARGASGRLPPHERPPADWPVGDRLPDGPPPGIDLPALERAIDAAFAEPEGKPRVRTRAVVVAHRGRLVAERYAPGYAANMPLPGWSMSKTWVNALVGIRVHAGRLDLEQPPDVAAWREVDDDPRRRIGWHHLLTMTAGLAWNEDYDDPNSDALRMLFGSTDHAAAYASQPVAATPGSEYLYTSGGTNLICRLLRQTFATDADYWQFPRQALFEPLHMHSAVLETDPGGIFVGSSYGFATARDWARFGLLLQNDGTAGARRLLPEGWIARSAKPAPNSDGRFGWHVWLNADPDGDGPRARMWPDLPADLMHLDGHEGQYCVVMPSTQLVIVRLGCTKSGGFGLRALLRDVLAACR